MPSASGSITAFLSGGGSLGRARPIAPPPAAAPTYAASDSDGDDAVSEDERVLALRVARSEDPEGDGGGTGDWMREFAPTSEEEDDDDDDEEAAAAAAAAKPAATSKRAATAAKTAATKPSATAPAKKVAAVAAPRARAPAASFSAAPVGAAPPATAVVVTKERDVSAGAKRAREPAPAAALEPTATSLPAAGKKQPAVVPAATAAAATPTAPRRALPPAFVPKSSAACVFIGNLPLTADAAALSALLSRFGALRGPAHIERNNAGRPVSFGYAEFATPAAAAAALRGAGAAPPELGGFALTVKAYTPESNYRRPDGSRAKRPKKAATGGA